MRDGMTQLDPAARDPRMVAPAHFQRRLGGQRLPGFGQLGLARIDVACRKISACARAPARQGRARPAVGRGAVSLFRLLLRAFELGEGAGQVEVTAALFHTRGMKINTALLLIACICAAWRLRYRGPAACSAAACPGPDQSRRRRGRCQAPTPATSLTKPVTANWRDAAQTSGAWTYAAEPGGSAVRFGLPGAAPLLVIRCERGRLPC